MSDNPRQISTNTTPAGNTSTTKGYEVHMTHRCEKAYQKRIKKDSTGLKVWADSVLRELATNPTLGGKLAYGILSQYGAVHSKNDTYRIIYKAEDFPTHKVLVIAIGPRDKIYPEATNEAKMLLRQNE
ncbi:MAG TPA: hypothetical protein VMV00_00775 [Candidatus Baltobacteraceae bacterium]|nr:hypothetical protein [Candidatus Baltobacteraceae bacterium]